jgi:16S rRNA (cytidine1402-2'-O)-methyltransferase
MSRVYLIPSLLAAEATPAIPAYVVEAIRDCQVFFVENERTTRRFFKSIWKEMVIDEYEWQVMSEEKSTRFRECLNEGKNIGIVSEAGCPGVADPGQELVAIAHEMNVNIRPLVGPSAILLALMASGMNGQQFRFNGYLPIDNVQRIKALKDLETESAKQHCTQVFIETPYRNNQMIEAILKNCRLETRLCIAADITGNSEWIKTRTVGEWQQDMPGIHKRPAIFLLLASS